ncbi:phosphatase PAP2/dual specificity phosphatase family protein [Niveibacterium umoris]|uniref:Protein-tyrosine phosphatase n=1 Tax=Niveibacterium umoris TaxID=1193620 RepID=A0A840BIL1_9RHOO|nr:phosphatase PAP2/dual specificity phosphatase family protein [Niveibacterium umoris]MBB4013381.1 protein-tyrosine phosphatase [Niveibacterium umoris]
MQQPPEARPWREAAGWLALLGPLFFISYGWANAIAAERSEVGSILFAWEHSIPFVPWTILPYWSIDLFYAASLFVCTTRAELRTHVSRLFAVQCISVACFLIWPLRFGFERPQADGLWGAMFTALGSFDKPFNQAPSLHISLLVLLWSLYARHLLGLPRRLLDIWFALIGVSVLTTFQHHFIDLPTGALLACLLVWALPFDEPSPLRRGAYRANRAAVRLGALYAAAAASCARAAAFGGGAALWLWWPAASLLLVALAYLWLGPRALGKHGDGRHAWPVRLLLAPYLIATWLNSRAWTHRLAPAVEVAPGVLLGRMPSRKDAEALALSGVIDLAPEMHNPLPPMRVQHLPALDLLAPAVATLADAARLIETERARGRLLVCCALGFSRSALAVAAWLVSQGHSPASAIARVRAARPHVVFGDAHVAALGRYAEGLQ